MATKLVKFNFTSFSMDRCYVRWEIPNSMIRGSRFVAVFTFPVMEIGWLSNFNMFLFRCTVGRFDLAIELMKSFAQEMSHGGQFLSSVKKALVPVKRLHGAEFDDMYCDFASPFRAYRDKEGRSGTLFT